MIVSNKNMILQIIIGTVYSGC